MRLSRTLPTAEPELRREIVEICKQLHAQGYLAAADGNVSARLPNGRILVTPSGIPKAFLDPEELILLEPDGTPLPGQLTPTGELPMHLAALNARPEMKVVVHAHPPTAIAMSLFKHLKLDDILPEVILSCGRLVVVSYARPLTEALARGVSHALSNADAVILERHGTVTLGTTLLEAFARTERLEHACEILWRAHSIARPTSLPEQEASTLRRLYERTRAAPR